MDLRTYFLLAFLTLTGCLVYAQPSISENAYVSQLNLSGAFPEKLLSTRSVVFHSHTFTEAELNTIQDYFQRTGIDAVAYFPFDILTAGKDAATGFQTFLTKREITNLVFAEKRDGGFRLTITEFKSGDGKVVEANQPAWSASNGVLTDLLKNLNRNALASLQRKNLLINQYPEMDLSIDVIRGKRNEFYAVDMKVDLVAVPKFGIDSLDVQLERIFETHFPFAYKMVDPGVSERDMRKQGMLYTLCFMHARANVVRELLGYPMRQSESAFVSITYPGDQQQAKTIPGTRPVFKVYFKHIDSGNVFLGTKWDADLTWQQALINNIRAMKAELRLN